MCSKLKCAIIDDEPLALDIIARFCRRSGNISLTVFSDPVLGLEAVRKERPDHSDFHSFPSAHTSILFANAAFVQRRYGWKWGLPAYVLATYTGWSRTFARKHDWWDVVAGAAIGAGCSYIFTRPFAQKHELTVVPVSDGRHFGIAASFRL